MCYSVVEVFVFGCKRPWLDEWQCQEKFIPLEKNVFAFMNYQWFLMASKNSTKDHFRSTF